MGLLNAVDVATSALLARRTQLETVAENVANASTPGYRRRLVQLQELPGAVGAADVGTGVSAAGIVRSGDALLEAQIDRETGGLGQDTAQATALTDMQSVVSGANGRGLLDSMSALFDAFGQLAADPSSATSRSTVLTAAGSLCDQFGQVGADLQSQMDSNDAKLSADVQAVNQDAQEVAGLNVTIAKAGGESKLPDAADRRGVLLNDLARLVGATAIPQGNGMVTVVVGGQHLVQEAVTTPLQMVQDPQLPQYHQVSLAGQSPPPGMSGEIAGLLAARQDSLQPALTELNSLAQTFADTINTQHSKGYASDGSKGEAFFTYDPSAPAATLAVNPDLVANPALVAAADAPGQSGNGNNALALEAFRTQNLPGQSYSLIGWETNILGRLGSDVQSANNQQDARQTVLTALQQRLDGISGVSLDEEAASLQKDQAEYTAAQQTIQVIFSLIDSTLQLAGGAQIAA